MIKIATAKRDSADTDKITNSVCFPIQSINPSLANAYTTITLELLVCLLVKCILLLYLLP